MSSRRVGSYEVALDDRSGRAPKHHAGVKVAGDDVARAGRRAADGVVAPKNADAIAGIAEAVGPARIHADVIALHEISGRTQIDSINRVAGDDVARAGRRAADGVVGRPAVDLNAGGAGD